MTLEMKASNEWMKRPNDERFESLYALGAAARYFRDNSKATVISNRQIEVGATSDQKGLQIAGPNGGTVTPTHWSFGQLAGLSGAPAGYLRKLHPALAADCLNWGLRVNRDVEEIGVLLSRKELGTRMTAATGPNYGRVWNTDIVDQLIRNFGDGTPQGGGRFTVPGTFGMELDEVTKENTTIYGSDRDMFVFLTDERNRIELPNRRNGQTGSLARGFFIWNSEVGSSSLGIAMFLFDYVCANRIVWGMDSAREIRVRHTAGAPDRWIEEIVPILNTYANDAVMDVENTLKAAQKAKIDDKVEDFLKKRKFTQSQIKATVEAHEAEEGRPIETVWDAVTGTTAAAKSIKWQDERVNMERLGGRMLDLVAA